MKCCAAACVCTDVLHVYSNAHVENHYVTIQPMVIVCANTTWMLGTIRYMSMML